MDHTWSLDGYLELDWKTLERLKRPWDCKLEDFVFNLFVVPALFQCNKAKKRINQFDTRLIEEMVGELRQKGSKISLQHQT